MEVHADSSASSIANRDEPIPMLKAGSSTPSLASQAMGSYLSPQSARSSPSKANNSSPKRDASNAPHSSLQTRIFSHILAQIVPEADLGSQAKDSASAPSATQVDRPNFSLPLMSANFRRFNARIGVVFVFQNRMIRLLSWHTPSHTLSFLAIYTFCCLDPALIVLLPLLACLYFLMVPAFLTRHPPPPDSEMNDVFLLNGPPSAPPRVIKPAPDMSKDFFRNMRDLQNSMEDFSVVHDHLIALIAPVTNFSDEKLSTLVFSGLCLSSFVLFFAAKAIPWKAIALIGGWSLILSSHPLAASALNNLVGIEFSKRQESIATHVHNMAEKDVVLDEPAETRHVEIFELQKHQEGEDWITWIYSPSPYDPQSPRRISGERPRGTRFFEDVQPPKGWEWKDKKWTLDIFSRDWVEERLITAVEVEIEGDRWVYDISAGEIDGNKPKDQTTTQAWEEGSGTGPKGDWRRRRWVRLIQRKAQRPS